MANPRTQLAPWCPETPGSSQLQKSGPRGRRGGLLGRRALLNSSCPQATAPFLHIGAVAGITLLAWPVADTFYRIHQRGANSTLSHTLTGHQCFCLLLLRSLHLHSAFCPQGPPLSFLYSLSPTPHRSQDSATSPIFWSCPGHLPGAPIHLLSLYHGIQRLTPQA